MHLIVDNIQVTLGDNVIDRSPYLRTLRDTNVGLDMSEDNIVKIDVLSIREFNSYITFLNTGNVVGIEGLYKTCDYMGHYDIPKNHGYTNGYYEAILLDWWNSKYNRELTMVMQYLDVACLTELDKIFGSKEYCIVGEYANNMYYGRKEYSNIDIYLSDRTHITYAIDYCKTNNYPITVCGDVVDIITGLKPVHIILKEHSSPYSILEGMDLDCLCCLIKDRKIYCNSRGSYSLKRKINNFNPDKYSSTYCDKLLKYNSIGIKYFLPGLDRNIVYDRYIEECIKNYHFINPNHEVPWLDMTVDVKLLGHYCGMMKNVSGYIRRTYDTVDILLICYAYGIMYDQEEIPDEQEIHSKIQLRSMQDFYLLTRF
jgi:hypothetical protein